MTDRDTRLMEINAALDARNLRSLPKLGDNSKKETEISSVSDIYEHSARFFTDIKFAVTFPDGKLGAHTVRFNANGKISDGAVMAVLINGKFAIVKQWRLPLGQWTYEMPRGFGEKLDNASSRGHWEPSKSPIFLWARLLAS